MPLALTYPGVYIEEVSSGVRPIVGVGTSIAAFVGLAQRGPIDEPVIVNSFGDFQRHFGGVWKESELGNAVRDFFLNGGSQAIVVRVFKQKAAGDITKETATSEATDAIAELKSALEAAASNPNLEVSTVVTIIAKLQKEKSLAGNKWAAAALEMLRSKVAKFAQQKEALPRPEDLRRAAHAAVPQLGGDVTQEEVDAANEAAKKVAEASDQKGQTLIGIYATAADTALKQAEGAPENGAKRILYALAEAAKPKPIVPALLLEEIENDSTGVIKLVSQSSLENGLAQYANSDDPLKLFASSVGSWGNSVRFRIEPTDGIGSQASFNIRIVDVSSKTEELIRNVTINGPRPLHQVLQLESVLLRAEVESKDTELKTVKIEETWKSLPLPLWPSLKGGNDGDRISGTDIVSDSAAARKEGLYALEHADLFNMLCIPPLDEGEPLSDDLLGTAAAYCEKRRAIFLIDPPASDDKDKIKETCDRYRKAIADYAKYAAMFFPSLLQPDPYRPGELRSYAPCGAIAGVFARTDARRGVWKAPAGFEASIVGTLGLSVSLNDAENGELNPLAINCLRTMPGGGRMIWGARTLAGNDRNPNEWKYIPVRRTALFIEESLYRGTQWVVFEPNDEPLWAQIRLNVGAFMNDLFRQGAFQGRTPREAYYVKCNKDNNPQNDIDKGIVNIEVGFAPLRPAEFVVVRLKQIAGDIQT
jgi:phage tail sheath protein FI